MSKLISFTEVPNYIGIRLDCDDKTEQRLHVQDNLRWAAPTEQEYDKAAAEIDSINVKGNGWQVYAWYDISGFNYWMKQQQETNYIAITIGFDEETILESELPALKQAIEDAIDTAYSIEEKYNYNPMEVPEEEI